jgi:hypothetical protein
MLLSGYFLGVQNLYADVSEHSVPFHKQVGVKNELGHPTQASNWIGEMWTFIRD